jgi:hypothetical protein
MNKIQVTIAEVPLNGGACILDTEASGHYSVLSIKPTGQESRQFEGKDRFESRLEAIEAAQAQLDGINRPGNKDR